MEREFFYKNITGIKKNALRLPTIIVVSALLGYTLLFDRASPFAAAFIGSLYGTGTAAAFLGGAAGMLLRGNIEAAVPSIIALAAIAIVRAFLGKSGNLPVRIGSALLSGAAVTATRIVTSNNPTDIIYAVVFGVISGIACFSLSSLYRLFREGNSIAMMKPSNTAAAGVIAAFAAAALASLETGIFNWGVILSGIIVITVAGRFKFAGGAAAGIVCAFGLAMAGEAYINAALILCVGGLASGICSRYGKIPQAAAFVFAGAISAVMLGLDNSTLSFLADTLVSSVAFMALPVEAISKRFSSRRTKATGSDPAEVFANRLYLVGNTMEELKFALAKTAETLDKEVNRDITWVYNSACDKICRTCRFNMKCWGDEYDESARMMYSLVKIMKNGKRVSFNDIQGSIGERCGRKALLSDELNDRYNDFVSAARTNRKIAEMRAILTSQLESTAKLFSDMSDEFRNPSGYDTDAAVKVEHILERCGAENPKAVVSMIGCNMIVEAYAEGKIEVSPEELGNMLTDSLRREFDLPDIMLFKKSIRITAFERAPYMVKTASCQYSKKNGQSCGDFTDTFVDGKGRAFTVLSDGMGSGGRARIDSAFACGMLMKMLEAGISVETAVEMLNASLLVKSADESFATLDVLKIDLYTGKTTLYKAGGANTFIKTGKHVVKLEGKGVPIGISFKTGVTDKTFTISEDDMVILTSDGAEIPAKWLEQTLEKENGKSLNELVETIAETAKFNCEKGREDDISVVAVQLVK